MDFLDYLLPQSASQPKRHGVAEMASGNCLRWALNERGRGHGHAIFTG